MANKVKKTNKETEKKHFVNPTETWWGKTIIWILFFGMVGSMIVMLIWQIIEGGF